MSFNNFNNFNNAPIAGWTSHGLYRYPVQTEDVHDPEYTSSSDGHGDDSDSEGGSANTAPEPLDEELEVELNYGQVLGHRAPANAERNPLLMDLALATMRFESATEAEDWMAIPDVVVVLHIIFKVLERRNQLRDSGLGTTRYAVWKTERLRNIDAFYDRVRFGLCGTTTERQAILQLKHGKNKLRPPQEVVCHLAFVALKATYDESLDFPGGWPRGAQVPVVAHAYGAALGSHWDLA